MIVKHRSFEDYSHLDDHTRQTSDTPGFKPFTKQQSFEDYSHPDVTINKLLILLDSNHLLNNSLLSTIHPEDRNKQTTDTPGFKPITIQQSFEDYSHPDGHVKQNYLILLRSNH